LQDALKKQKDVEGWVVAKLERSSADLSDVTHYLDGTTEYGDGGGVDANFDWSKVFEPLSVEEKKILQETAQKEESEAKTKQKDNFAKSIRATGKNWNEAFLNRVKDAKFNMMKFAENLKKNNEQARSYYNYSREAIDGVRELNYGAEKYADVLEKKLEMVRSKKMSLGGGVDQKKFIVETQMQYEHIFAKDEQEARQKWTKLHKDDTIKDSIIAIRESENDKEYGLGGVAQSYASPMIESGMQSVTGNWGGSPVSVFAQGGKIGFEGLAKKVAKRYSGKKVKPKYQDEYGKEYDSKEAMEVGRKVAAKVHRQQQGKM